jgi:glycosyltransferase involved in cell wall biosynthesis
MTETQRLLLDQLLPGRHSVVVPLPDFAGLSSTKTTREQARIALGLPPRAKIALFFGLVRPYKRLGDLVEAVGILHARAQEVFLVVAGEFWEPESMYIRQVQRLGLEESVRLLNRYVPNKEIAPLFRRRTNAVHLPHPEWRR